MSTTSNPFPQDAVTTASASLQKSFRTEYFGYAEEKAIGYTTEFGRPDVPASLVLGIRGKYGSGKTHLAFQIMEAVQFNAQKHDVPCIQL
jgi:DNA replication protein DnaC